MKKRIQNIIFILAVIAIIVTGVVFVLWNFPYKKYVRRDVLCVVYDGDSKDETTIHIDGYVKIYLLTGLHGGGPTDRFEGTFNIPLIPETDNDGMILYFSKRFDNNLLDARNIFDDFEIHIYNTDYGLSSFDMTVTYNDREIRLVSKDRES